LELYFQRLFVRQAALGAVFYIWLVSLGLAQILLNPKLHRIGKAGIAAMLIGLAYLNLYRYIAWVSGWLPALAAAAVVLFLAKPRLAVLGGIAFSIVAILFSGQVFGVFSEGGNAYSAMTRWEAWRILWEIIKNNPVFGVGMANYYFYTPFYSILGYNVSFNSHNNYVDIVAQSGFVGLIVLLWIFWELFRQGWGMYARLPESRERAYVAGALGGLIGTFVAGFLGDWVIPFAYNIGLNGFRASLFAFLFLGGMLAVARMVSENGAAERVQS
jgi:O-antigen ligase